MIRQPVRRSEPPGPVLTAHAFLARLQLDYHLYTSPLPHVGSSQSPIRSFFLSSSLREDLQKRSAALYETSPVPIPGLPESLHVYHSLHPLEPGTVGTTGPGGATTVEKSKRVFGLATEVYKAMSEVDGNAYVLRRVEGTSSGKKKTSTRAKAHSFDVQASRSCTTPLSAQSRVGVGYDTLTSSLCARPSPPEHSAITVSPPSPSWSSSALRPDEFWRFLSRHVCL